MEIIGYFGAFLVVAVVWLLVIAPLIRRGPKNVSRDGGTWVGAERFPPGDGKRFSYYRNGDGTMQVESQDGNVEEVTVVQSKRTADARRAAHGRGDVWRQL